MTSATDIHYCLACRTALLAAHEMRLCMTMAAPGQLLRLLTTRTPSRGMLGAHAAARLLPNQAGSSSDKNGAGFSPQPLFNRGSANRPHLRWQDPGVSDARTALRSDVRTDLDAVIILAGRLLILPCTCTNMLSQARVYVHMLMCRKSCMWGNVGVAQSHAIPTEAPYITWLHGPIKLCLFCINVQSSEATPCCLHWQDCKPQLN